MGIRVPFVAANWKMHKTRAEARSFVAAFLPLAPKGGVRLAICPTLTALPDVAAALNATHVAVGAQNMHWEAKGAFTGEASADQIKEAGATCVILGHSERRKVFMEQDADINRKVKAALAGGLTPIFCVGETLDEREAGKTQGVVMGQLRDGMSGIPSEEASRIVVAYEPVWAIGTGKNATPEQAQEVHAFIRSWLAEAYGKVIAEGIVIQYGGSVKPDNIAALMKGPDIDGALVGGAALDPGSFAAIASGAAKARS